MKKYMLLLSFLMAFILPNLLFSHSSHERNVIAVPEFTGSRSEAKQQIIRVKDHDKVLEIELDDYVIGVLLGEMPADFEPEALKAQAVATRTYTLRKVQKKKKHSEADLCTDAACCQAYTSVSDYLSGSDRDKSIHKIQQAVTETTGQVLTYQGNLIEATYFSCSGGRTEDAVAVWGTNVPYLQSVDSPGEEDSKYYEQNICYSRQDFLSKLGLPESLNLTNNSFTVTYTEGNGVDHMDVSEFSFDGTQLRTLLGLPSTAFTLEVDNDNVVIFVRGYGHRVGMSQYGAESMAVNGKTYDEILMHYYPGTKLETFTQEQINAIFDKAGNL